MSNLCNKCGTLCYKPVLVSETPYNFGLQIGDAQIQKGFHVNFADLFFEYKSYRNE